MDCIKNNTFTFLRHGFLGFQFLFFRLHRIGSLHSFFSVFQNHINANLCLDTEHIAVVFPLLGVHLAFLVVTQPTVFVVIKVGLKCGFFDYNLNMIVEYLVVYVPFLGFFYVVEIWKSILEVFGLILGSDYGVTHGINLSVVFTGYKDV